MKTIVILYAMATVFFTTSLSLDYWSERHVPSANDALLVDEYLLEELRAALKKSQLTVNRRGKMTHFEG